MISKVRTIGNEVNSSRICIDSYKEGVPIGRLYHSRQASSYEFKGWMTLIKEMNQLMDVNDFPQAEMKLRSFQADTSTYECDNELFYLTENRIHGEIATFRIRIMFRQNATWQGVLRWIERGKEERFRSVLELMTLMDSCFIESESTQQLIFTDREKSVI